MYEITSLSEAIQEIGFACLGCGVCCRGDEETIRVIISPPEVAAIESITGMRHDEIVTPYPEFIESDEGGRYTFEWCLRMESGRCIFNSDEGRCTTYKMRPWICQTYPFALDGESLVVSECPGIGGMMGKDEAYALASTLLLRREAEEEEEEAVKRIFSSSLIPKGKSVVFDSRGMWSIHG